MIPFDAIPYMLLLGFIYSSTLTASSFGLGEFHSLTFVALRLVLASLAYLVIFSLRLRKQRFPKERTVWLHGAVLGIFGTAIPMNLMIASLHYLSSGMVGILITIGPALTVLLAHFFLNDERLNQRRGLGLVLALGGALLLAMLGESGLPDVQAANPLGYLFILVAQVSGSSTNVYTRRFMRDLDTIQVSAVRMFVAMLVVLPVAFAVTGLDIQAVTAPGWLVLLWVGLGGTFLANLLAFYNIKRFGATASAIVAYLIPAFTGILGVALLGETITRGMLIGMGIILAGVTVLNERPRKIAVDAPAAPGID
jgi:drug/metabolite transporter (DMT)-like permease